jgi:hypothetical protein
MTAGGSDGGGFAASANAKEGAARSSAPIDADANVERNDSTAIMAELARLAPDPWQK